MGLVVEGLGFSDRAFRLEELDVGGCQNYGPFLGTLNIRCRITVGIQKGIIILTTIHVKMPGLFWYSRVSQRDKALSQRVHVGIWYILMAQRGSHIPTLRAKYIATWTLWVYYEIRLARVNLFRGGGFWLVGASLRF